MPRIVLLAALLGLECYAWAEEALDSLPTLLLPDAVEWEATGAGHYLMWSEGSMVYRGTFDPVTRKGEGTFFSKHEGEADVDSAAWAGTWTLEPSGKTAFIGEVVVRQFSQGAAREYVYESRIMEERTPEGLQPLNGYHEILYIDGSGYAGEWKRGRKHGQGAIFHCMCMLGSWEGGWKNGMPHGQGAEYHPLWNWRFEGRKREGEWVGRIDWYLPDFYSQSEAPFSFHNLEREYMTVKIRGGYDHEDLEDVREAFEANVDDLRAEHSLAFTKQWEPFIADFRGLLQMVVRTL